jgi:hypothetical protein
MVGLLLTLIFSLSASSAECSRAALLEKFNLIEEGAGSPSNEEDIAEFSTLLAFCSLSPEELSIATRLEKAQSKNAVADVRAKLQAILQTPRRDGRKKIDELRAFGQGQGMKEKEFDEARNRWAGLYRAARKKLREQTATRCETKNQSARFPAAHEQGNLGWCYAYVAADLLSFETKKPVAPLAIGLGYFQKKNHENFVTSDPAAKEKILNSAGGHIAEAIQVAKEEGICPARQDVAAGDLFDRVLSLLDKTKIPTFLSSQEKFCDAYASASLTLFPNLSTSEFERILRKAGVRDILQEMRKASCKKKTRLPKNLKVEELSFPNDAGIQSLETIQRALLRNSVAGISVNMSAILKEKIDPANHAMIVTGQEWNPQIGQCEFLVRNSWGKQCETFDTAKINCDPETGILRVPADLLDEITFGTTVVSR